MREDYKSGFVAIIGRPNVGKSTLMNHLIGQKIAITSRKAQTTRNKIQTVYTCERGQIVFLDTPGIHKAKNKLGEYMVNVASRTFKDADVILWLVEPGTQVGPGDRHIAEQLKNCKLPVILVINKVDTVKKEEDFKRLFHAKSLGIMPHAKFHKKRTQTQELIVLDNPRIPRSFLEAARTVRRRIERAQKETGMKSFLVTSAMPGEGKSTVSANIAISLAMKGYKVILVDADLRNPSTAKVLGMNEQELGTLEVMKGEVNIDDAVQQYKNTSVKVLAGSTPIQDTSTVLSGKNMRQFIKELEAEADFVIIDTPPSGLLSDAAIVAQYVDGAVFVIRQDYTDVDRILEGMEILSGSGAEITGCILNDVNVRTSESQHYMNSYRTKGETL